MGNELVMRKLNKAAKGVLELAEYYANRVSALETQLNDEKTHGADKLHRLIDEIRQVVYKSPVDEDANTVIDDIMTILTNYDSRTRSEQVEAARRDCTSEETVFDHKGVQFGE